MMKSQRKIEHTETQQATRTAASGNKTKDNGNGREGRKHHEEQHFRPDHQRQGIGKKLLEEALATFPNVYQRLLATDRSEKNLAFYQSLGFVELSEQACTGMIYKY